MISNHTERFRWQKPTLFFLLVALVAAGVSAQNDSSAPAPVKDTPTKAKDAEVKQPSKDTVKAAPSSINEEEEPKSIGDHFNDGIGKINSFVAKALFFDASFGLLKSEVKNEEGVVQKDADGEPLMTGPEIPFMVIFLAMGAVFFTFWHGWINIRGFGHAIAVVRGKFTSKDDPGDVTPFRALTSALSATVGLGNIAGVAIAVKTGGPGAVFWMMFLGLFGMTAKFHESTLAQLYRKSNPDGSISGGPMYYLDIGMKEKGPGMAIFGKALAIIFAIFCMGGALGGGNMFQANQSFEGFYSSFVATPSLAENTRKEMSIETLRPLLTEKQLNAVKKTDDTLKDAKLESIRSELPETRVREIVTTKQVRNKLLAEVIRPTLTTEQLETLRLEQKSPPIDLEALRGGLKNSTVVAAASKAQTKAAMESTGIAKDETARGDVRHRVSIGYGLIMAVLVGIVVIGGITRIGAATSKIVPTMCLLYVFGCSVIIIANIDQVPSHIGLIFKDAFAWESAFGGFIGVMIIGFQRAAFSSEAGLGSSAIAHSCAKTSEPVREGFVASLEPFIDTIIICFMTAMVVLITDAYIAPELVDESNGSAVTLYAFQKTRVAWLAAWFPSVLSISIVLFAFSTQISWCYYGERAYGYLFGLRSVVVFRLIFVTCVFVGAVASLGPVLDFSDLMILSMAFPNILGGLILAGVVKRKAKDYWRRLKAGEMDMDSDSKSQSFDI